MRLPGIITIVEAVGMTPQNQLPVVFQLVLTAPLHVPATIVITTSSVDAVQGLLDIVHLNV